MYIVRWLAGHPIIAVWALGAVAILLSYGSIGKKNDTDNQNVNSSKVSTIATTTKDQLASNEANLEINTTKSSTTNDIDVEVGRSSKNEALNLSEEKVSSESTFTAEVEEKPQSNGSNVLERVVAKLPVSEKKRDQIEPAAESVIQKITKVTEIARSKEVAGKKQGAKADGIENNLDTNQTEVADLGQLTSEEMLTMAREAYWNNGLDEAAQIYKQLIKAEPKIVEHRGELGNVYWRQGYPKKAAEIYSEIAIPMIESGNSNRVANMIGFIGLFYPDRATVIQDRLMNHQNR